MSEVYILQNTMWEGGGGEVWLLGKNEDTGKKLEKGQ